MSARARAVKTAAEERAIRAAIRYIGKNTYTCGPNCRYCDLVRAVAAVVKERQGKRK